MRRFIPHAILALTLMGAILMSSPDAFGLTAEVKNHLGSPMIFIDGKPTSPLTFFGWASGARPVVKTIGTEWTRVSYTFVAPETTEGASGIHFRVGGNGPGTVWVDKVQLYPGRPVETPAENWVRQGDWEGTKEQISKDWTLFQAQYADAEATWDVDPSTKVSGNQSLRIDIKNAGTNPMHLHFYQTGYSVKKGQTYTYSLWMKADKKRTIDFMALHIGGPWTIYGGESSVYQEQVKLARDAGVHIYSFGIPMAWPKPGEKPNFAGVDAAILTTLQADPDGLLLPRFGMAPPAWWLDEHPDAKMLFDDGKYEGWSMASEEWRAEMQTHLRALVRYCEDKYGDHMLGYHPCGQHTGEWFYYRSWEPRLSDFSPDMDRGFAKWLKGKYETTDALRGAWNNDAIDFDTVRVPTAEQQKHTELGFFRDPVKERKVIDYFDYKQIAMEEPLEMMARVIKDETGGTKLTCFFYGYLFDMHGIPMGPQNSGHLAMSRLIDCPDVDILCSPISYLDRQQGGAGCFMSAVDSVRTGGKLWLNEDDTRTYLAAEDAGFGRISTPQGSFWVHQRNFAQIWPRRLACWYMDLGGVGWLNGKDLWDNIAPLQAFYQRHIDEPSTWAPEVALIVDEESPSYTKCDRALHSPLVYQMRSRFFRLGVPFRIHLLSDLVAGKVPPAKAYFFANCFRLDAAQRAAIARQTKGKTATWFYGGGLIDEDDASAANMSAAVGLKLVAGAPQPGRVSPEPAEKALSALVEGLAGEFGTKTTLDPLWVVEEDPVQVIGRYADGSVAAAAKQTDAGLRVYVGALHCPAKLLRNILQESGVHLYCDSDDVILTDGRFLSITATFPGPKHLVFPGRCDVTEATTGRLIAGDVDQLDVELELGETRLYRLQ